MKVLVTGGAGYVGSHACKALAAEGHTPVVYDDLSRGHDWAVRWGPLERGNILDAGRLNAAFAAHRPEAVLHFAALAYVGESVEAPAVYYHNNVVGTLTLLEAMRTNGIRKIVFSSSCATYGIPERLPLTENHAQRPINPYGRTKLIIEQVLADYRTAYGLTSIALRYFNAAGADPAGEIGELHEPETHLIPGVLLAALGRRPAVQVFGNDYATEDGTCVRDYIHVTDLANAHVRALEALEGADAAPAYNLGTGQGFSVREILDAARRITGCTFVEERAPRRPGDPAALVADAASAQRALSWKPAHSDLDAIIGTAWAWLRKQESRPATKAQAQG